jgi:putative restriction endonuclease
LRDSNMSNRVFGHPFGVPVGTVFSSRKELRTAGVHGQNRAGISGTERDGADAIVISGGYEDDVDDGDTIVYTGQGGRDPNSGKQIEDQTLTRGNLALVVSRSKGLPVRVIRSTPEGYRFDGLYRVDDAWHEPGRSGYLVWRYRLVALDPAVALVPIDGGGYQQESAGGPPAKKRSMVTRIVRDTQKSRALKELYNYRCQICMTRLEGLGGPYAEGAHVRPLGAPHDGPDTADNLLCLCPNHHVLFDLGGFTIDPDFGLIGLPGSLHVHAKHKLSKEHIRYHREHYS